jgi:hypothetical protein
MPKTEWRSILALVTAGLIVSTGSALRPPSVSSIGDAVETASANIADNLSNGPHLGFDTFAYPGDDAMHAWMTADKPYRWVGYYLSAPCHSDSSWEGKRETLSNMGWGMAVIYVGQQTWGKTPRTLSSSRMIALQRRSDCATDLISADEGTRNADDAIARASGEGFAGGVVIFLDLERMEKVPPAMRDYYRAWTSRMLTNGTFRPGIYAHEHNAQQVFDDVRDVFRAVGDTETPRMWIAGGKGFDVGRAPQDVGFAFAGVWQGVIDIARSVAEVKLPVDLNVAAWASPSESGVGTR